MSNEKKVSLVQEMFGKKLSELTSNERQEYNKVSRKQYNAKQKGSKEQQPKQESRAHKMFGKAVKDLTKEEKTIFNREIQRKFIKNNPEKWKAIQEKARAKKAARMTPDDKIKERVYEQLRDKWNDIHGVPETDTDIANRKHYIQTYLDESIETYKHKNSNEYKCKKIKTSVKKSRLTSRLKYIEKTKEERRRANKINWMGKKRRDAIAVITDKFNIKEIIDTRTLLLDLYTNGYEFINLISEIKSTYKDILNISYTKTYNGYKINIEENDQYLEDYMAGKSKPVLKSSENDILEAAKKINEKRLRQQSNQVDGLFYKEFQDLTSAELRRYNQYVITQEQKMYRSKARLRTAESAFKLFGKSYPALNDKEKFEFNQNILKVK